MVLRYLEILEAVAECGTFTGAAKKLYITQSAVSHAVAELEKQAGTVLFERLPKGAVLTQCGVSLLEEARSILTACRNLDRRMNCLEENAPVKIVSSITIASFLLPEILRELKRSHPQIRFSVGVASANAALGILQRGDADMAFWEGTAPKGNFHAIPLGAYSLCAACAPEFVLPVDSLSGDPLLPGGTLSENSLLSESTLSGDSLSPGLVLPVDSLSGDSLLSGGMLSEEFLLSESTLSGDSLSPGLVLPVDTLSPELLCRCPLLLREQGSAIRDTLDNTLALLGLKAEPVWESVNSLALVKAAEAGLGITILPERLLADSLFLKKLRIIHLDKINMENQMLALFHKDKYITKPFQILIDRLQALATGCSPAGQARSGDQ